MDLAVQLQISQYGFHIFPHAKHHLEHVQRLVIIAQHNILFTFFKFHNRF
jgi:hypothetical protein